MQPKTMSNPKWLNRRPVSQLKKSSIMTRIITPEKKLKLPLIWLIGPILIGLMIAIPLGIIFNKDTGTDTPTQTENPFTIPPDRAGATTFNQSFNLKGWRPTSTTHYYGVHRPKSPTGQTFANQNLFLPSAGSSGKIPLVDSATNAQINSEFYSYSYDEDAFLRCSNSLLSILKSRTRLPLSDPDKINIPPGFSIEKLHDRIKNTYCTHFVPSREELIQNLKEPYVDNVRNGVYYATGESTAMVKDSLSRKFDMWYEHDAIPVGERTYEFKFPTIFPESYRTRNKVIFDRLITGDNLHSYDVAQSTNMRETRNAWWSLMFYRYFINSPFRDSLILQEPTIRKKISADHIIQKTLLRPGMGSRQDWEQVVARDYTGDTSFKITDNHISATLPGITDDTIAFPDNWPQSQELNYVWNGDYVLSSLALQNLIQAFEVSNTSIVGHFTAPDSSFVNKDDYINFFMKATFDNVRNIIVNKKFGSTATSTTKDTNKMYLHDAHRVGWMRGLGRFFYEVAEGPSSAHNNMQSDDMESFEHDIFEEQINSLICSASSKTPFVSSICPTTKASLVDQNGVTKTVYVPTKTNEVTEYYAELEETNALWRYLYDELENILKQNKYKDVPFSPFDNNSQNATRRATAAGFNNSLTAEVIYDNFDIFDAFVELFRDYNVLGKLLMSKQTSQSIKDEMSSLIQDAIVNFEAIANLKLNTSSMTYAEIQTLMKNAIKGMQDVVNLYATSEATRKLNTEYEISATNSQGSTFKHNVVGRNLPYHLYVRYMKITEAREDYRFDDVGNPFEFDIPIWAYNGRGVKPTIDNRKVKMRDATDGEVAFFVIHYLKDTYFPWIPIVFNFPDNTVFVEGIYDMRLGEHSPKYDGMLQEAETMINNYMSSLLASRYRSIGFLPYRITGDDGTQKWVDFDIIKYNPVAGTNSNDLAIFKVGARYSDNQGYVSNFFNSYDSNLKSLHDFMFYAQAHYLVEPNKKRPIGYDSTITTHCITTYETNGPKNEIGYEDFPLPTNKLNPNAPSSNKLLDYFYIPTGAYPGGFNPAIYGTGRLHVKSDIYFDSNPFARDVVSKYIHIYFSKCISNEQYSHPLDITDTDYDSALDEWAPMIENQTFEIRWDLLDLKD